MKHVVVVAHPDPQSLTLALAHAYENGARSMGAAVMVRDLYRMGFDPCLKVGEAGRGGVTAPAPDVAAERALIGDADVFTFVYPLWFYAPPAILKGYVDRVFGMGFGYGPIHGGGNVGLLTGRRLLAISLSGAPVEWMKREGTLQAVVSLFDTHLAEVCGLELAERLHFGGVVPNLRADVAADHLGQARAAGARLAAA